MAAFFQTHAVSIDWSRCQIGVDLSDLIESGFVRVQLHRVEAYFFRAQVCARQIRDSYLAIACPAIHPVVHAAWKLNPPVMPSKSSNSPAHERPGVMRLFIVLKSLD